MKSLTDAPMLLHGSGFFHLEDVADTSVLATVFRDTLDRRAGIRPETVGSDRRSRRIHSKIHSRDLYTHGLLTSP
ncbi:hypothetical protein [Streptomyces sp. NPDC056949]|uniref:hypothetical protein n=1 Tax=Streptomyces sp. NPDC056949 TaxID=3345976 RepID=UPI0036457C8F